MREAVGSYFLTGLVVTFIVLFTGYLCLSINMNKAYKVKNEIINIIQKNNGLDEDALDQIQDYMTKVGYRTTGSCDAGEQTSWEGYGISGHSATTRKSVFCIRQVISEAQGGNDYTKEQFPETAYYQVKVFFAVDLPVVRQLFTFGLKGSTKKLFYPVTI